MKELPFFINKGYHPQLQIQTDLENLSETSRPYLVKLELVYEKLKKTLWQLRTDIKAQQTQNNPQHQKFK